MSISFEERTTASGATKHRCVVKKVQNKEVVFRKSKTFDSFDAAKDWGERLERELESSPIPVSELIQMYIDAKPDIGRSKKATLIKFMKTEFANLPASLFTEQAIKAYAMSRQNEGVKASTICHDISSVRSVFVEAGRLLGLPINDKEFTKVIPSLRESSVIADSQADNTVITEEQLRLIREALSKRESHHANIIPFNAIVTLMLRLGLKTTEVCQLKWADLDLTRQILVRSGRLKRQSNIVSLDQESIEVLKSQQTTGELIFPYGAKSVSEGFGRVCASIGFPNLAMRHLLNNWEQSL